MRISKSRPVLAIAVAAAVVVASVGTALTPSPAAAADPGVDKVTTLLTRLATEVIPETATSPALSSELPTLATSPAAAVGLPDALLDLLAPGGLIADADTQPSLTALRGYLDGKTGGGWVIAAGGAGDVVALTLTRTVTSNDGQLSVQDPGGVFSLSTTTGIRVTGVLEIGLTMTVDGPQAVLTNPSLSITTTATLPATTTIDAGVGVLGVSVSGSDSDYSLTSTATTTWANPDNDAGGVLAFDDPTTAAPNDGELAQAGAGTGLVTTARTGTTEATLLAHPRASSLLTGLPSLGATVDVSTGGDFETPVVVSSVDPGAAPFLSMTPRDLAQGLAQAASSVLSMQGTSAADLPLMRGDLADAVDAVGGIVAFLRNATPDPVTGDQTPGLPSFPSVQDMLEQLDGATGLPDGFSLSVTGAAYDDASEQVSFTLDTLRQAVDLPLNPAAEPVSGTGLVSGTTVSSTDVEFTEAMVGRKITVAGANATIASVTPGGGSATVDAWLGAAPSGNVLFSVELADPKIGAPELADTLADDAAIRTANANISTATVSPDLSLSLPLVIDLQPASTDDCDPGPGVAACPFRYEADGITQIITSLPLTADRFLLDTSAGGTLLAATVEVTSPIEIQANAGFVGVRLTGDVSLQAPASGPMLSLGLVDQGEVPLPAFIESVRQQGLGSGSAFTVDVGGSARADVSVAVPGAAEFFGGDASAGITLTMPDITDPASTDVTFTAPDAASLLQSLDIDPDDPAALFAGIQALLQQVGDRLIGMQQDGLDTEIPFLGISPSTLFGASASGGPGTTYVAVAENGTTPAMTELTDNQDAVSFDDAMIGRRIVVGSTIATVAGVPDEHTLLVVPQLTTTPSEGTRYAVENEILGAFHTIATLTPADLQETVDRLAQSLGDGATAGFRLLPGSGGDPARLRLDLDWQRAFASTVPFSLDAGLGDLIGTSADGSVTVSADGALSLALELPLTSAAMSAPQDHVTVDTDDTSLGLGVELDASGSRLAASLGPVNVSLGRPAPDPAGTEARAGFGIEASNPTGGPASLGDFFSGLEVALTDGDSCGTDVLCGEFPVVVNGTEATDPLTVSAPVVDAGGQPDLAATLSGTQVTVPSEIENLVNGAAFKLDGLGAGLEDYLFYLEAALRTGSGNGTLPVIGKDLQAGADFLGETRRAIDVAFDGAGVPSTAAEVEQFLIDQLEGVLPGVGTGEVVPGLVCDATLPAVGTPTVTPDGFDSGSDTPQDYWYAVVAKATKDTVESDTVPSAAVKVTNSDTLGAARTNTVQWTDLEDASGYRVIRSLTDPATGATWKKIADLGAGATSYTDDDTGTATSYVPATEQAPVDGCPDDTPATQIDGVSLTLSLGQGNPSAADGCTGAGCLSASLPVDLGLPGLSLKTPGGAMTGSVGWALDLTVALDRTDGFYVDTSQDGELRVGAGLGLADAPGNGPDLMAQLAILDVEVRKNEPIRSELRGLFSIDLNGLDDDKLTLAEIASAAVKDAVEVTVSATVDIDWNVEATASSALPGISADFVLSWGWDNDEATDAAGLQVAFNDVTIDAGDFLGKAIKPYLQQVLDAVKPMEPILDIIFTPIPVISDLSVAAGGDEVTIATLAEQFSTLAGGPKIGPFLDVIKQVRDLVKNLSCSAASCGINVGSFTLVKSKVLNGDANPSTAKSAYNETSVNANATADLKGKSSALGSSPAIKNSTTTTLSAGTPGFTIPLLDEPTLVFELLVGGDVPIVEFDSGELKLGFDFQRSFGPIYAPPPVNMVIGGGASVSLRVAAGFDTYGIRRAIETGEAAQVLDSLYFKTTDASGAPIPVVKFEGYLQAGASLNLVVVEVGVVGGIKLTVGFYWNDPNSDGKFRLFEFATAALRNPICLFNVGGELSLFIKVFVTLGISPFSVSFDFTLVNIKLLDFSLKPDCEPPPPRLAGAKGGSLYLFAGKFGGAGPRGDAFWTQDPDPEKPETWVVRQVPAHDGEGPTVTVAALGIKETFPADDLDTVVLDGRGFAGAMNLSLLGAAPPGAQSQAAPFTLDAVVLTGDGPDQVTTGEGDSFVSTGAGDDIVVTQDRTDLSKASGAAGVGRALVAGGPGKDAISVGNGDDVVSGDSSLVTQDAATAPVVTTAGGGTATLSGAVDVSALKGGVGAAGFPASSFTGLYDASVGANDDADQISAGLGRSVLSGNGGDDIIGTANDSVQADLAGIKGTPQESRYRARSTTIVGGAGGDRIKSGSADDDIFTGAKGVLGEEDPGSGDALTDTNTVDTGAGSDTVYGSNAKDFVVTHSTASQSATVYGAGADDVLTGGLGTDELYGGPGNDYLVAAPATVSDDLPVSDVLGAARRVSLLPQAGVSQAKLLVGGTGSDRIYGADGPSLMFGDSTDDAVRSGGEITAACPQATDPVSDPPTETSNPADAADLIQGGAGVDDVDAGGGGDWAYTYGGGDRVCGSSGNDRLFGGGADDVILAGSGADQASGEAGSDRVYGNDGPDVLRGNEGDDRLQGNAGGDWADGGSGADVVLGGTSKAGRADGDDVLLGGTGGDVVVGDNAQSDDPAAAPYPTDLASTDAASGGTDRIYGGDDADTLYGGLEGDFVWGGSGDDSAEGNPGSDTIRGEDDDDDIVGGSSQARAADPEAGFPDVDDDLFGDDGQDVIAGDNASISRGASPHPVMAGRGLTTSRAVDLLDEGPGTPSGVSGGDRIEGGESADVVFAQRGADTVDLGEGQDYGEGGPGVDSVEGQAGDDDLVGGSFTPASGSGSARVGQPDGGDTLDGGPDEDVVLGDNGALTRVVLPSPLTAGRVTVQRAIAPYDLGDSPTAGTFGADTISGAGGNDVLLGQDGADLVEGDAGDDYAEGGQGRDLVRGGSEDDDLVGGSSSSAPGSTTTSTAGAAGQPDGADNVVGGSGDDLLVGDNALLTRPSSGRDWRTQRANPAGTALVPGRGISLLDLEGPVSATANGLHSAGDALSGQTGVDVILGQDGVDAISGGGDDDYVEGQGASDTIRGDLPLGAGQLIQAPSGAAWTTPAADAAPFVEGQDDLTGGWSLADYRDAGDVIHGDGNADFVVADNGAIARVLDGATEQVYTERYGTLRPGDAKVRVAGGGAASTRFCDAAAASATCESAGAFGADVVRGGGGDDVLYGQDGDDVIWAGTGDDDVYGELGDDVLHGEDGEDAILGDRGGIRNRYEDGSRSVTTSVNQPPAVTYVSRREGSVSREVDQLHDVNGTDFVGSGAGAAMAKDGITRGGADRISGGPGHDSLYGGFGDDLVNGDSGGDAVLGGRGNDALWGGRGADCAGVTTEPARTTCLADRGTDDAHVDYLFGGKDDDVIDWRPRGSTTTPGTTCSLTAAPFTTVTKAKGKTTQSTVDPCSWLEMTGLDNDTPLDNQHHQGVDWAYGGWDRDAMQADLSDNGPHEGDRLIDWNGVYNLWSHCNAAYGGFTDVRGHSPAVQELLQAWVHGVGAGQTAADATTPGTSAYDDLALAYTSDFKDHATGKPYPSTPGHFDDPNACTSP